MIAGFLLRGFTMFLISPVRIYNVCECFIWHGCKVFVDNCDWHVYVLIGNFDTILLLFIKDNADKPVNGML